MWRFLEIGLKDAYLGRKMPMQVLLKGISIFAVDAVLATQSVGKEGRRILGDIIQLFHEKKLKGAQPLRIYPLSQLKDAFRFIQSGKSIGKLVVEIEQEDIIPVRLPSVDHVASEEPYSLF